MRVFISSTFRDMNAEREELGKFIFPELRKLCREREVEFIEVDLRWGVTEDQSKSGDTLGVCLAEIDACRPYFIGILGEYYGWVPGTFKSQVIEENPWLAEFADRSATELEILHGVLNNPAMASRATFFFRDPHFIEQITEDQRPIYGSESVEAARKLADLKQRIRESGLPLVDNYSDPHSAALQIGEYLRKAIDAEFPASEVHDRLAEEAAGHEIFAQSRAKVYIGREADMARLDSFVAGVPEQMPQVLAVLGPSGSGKSALLANWGLRWRSEHPEEFFFLHFVGSTPGSADYAGLLRRLLGEIKAWFNIMQDLPDTDEALRNALPNWLALAASKCQRLVLVLDGLNQLEDRDQALDLPWLPEQFPSNTRVLVSTLPGRSLDALRARTHSEFEVQLLSKEERLKLAAAYLARYKKHLEDRRAQRIVSTHATANPLYCASCSKNYANSEGTSSSMSALKFT